MYSKSEDELPLEYWKDLAEKRRVALDESLTENESLHTSLSYLEEERDRLKVASQQKKLNGGKKSVVSILYLVFKTYLQKNLKGIRLTHNRVKLKKRHIELIKPKL